MAKITGFCHLKPGFAGVTICKALRSRRGLEHITVVMTNGATQAPLAAYLEILRERLNVNVVMLSTIDEERHCIIGKSEQVGIVLPSRDIPLNASICRHVSRMNFPLVVSDVQSHPLFQKEKGVRESVAGAYLGYPVRDLDGRVLGVLAAIYDRIRAWSSDEQSLIANAALDLRRSLEG